MTYETLSWSFSENIAEISLNRPDQANALNGKMAEELFDAACRCGSKGARAVVISGKGKLFCAGGDLNEFDAAEDKAHHVTKLATILHAALSRFSHLDAPVIVAVNGTAGGGGFSLALSGDIILASENAKFVSAYTASGLSPDGSSTYFLAKHIGLLRAKELFLTNRVLNAQEALNWGMVTRVTKSEDLLNEARKLAADFANGPTKSLGAVKQLLESAYSESFETQMDKEVRSIAAMLRTHDGQHGIEAFLEKKRPLYRGE